MIFMGNTDTDVCDSWDQWNSKTGSNSIRKKKKFKIKYEYDGLIVIISLILSCSLIVWLTQ